MYIKTQSILRIFDFTLACPAEYSGAAADTIHLVSLYLLLTTGSARQVFRARAH